MPRDIERQLGFFEHQARRHAELGQYQAAIRLSSQVSELTRRHYGEDHPRYLTSLNNLALLHKEMGDYAEAERLYRQVMEAVEEGFPGYATVVNNLAALQHELGNYGDAAELLERALELKLETPECDPESVVATKIKLAGLHTKLGNQALAESLLQESVDALSEAGMDDDPVLASALNNLAMVRLAAGKLDDAEQCYERALGIVRKTQGRKNRHVATILNNLAEIRHLLGEYADAEALYVEVMEIQRDVLGEDHIEFARSLNNLGAVYKATGRYAEAETLYRQALENRRRILGEDHLDYGESLQNLASLYVRTGRLQEALALMRESAAIDDRAIGQVFSIGSESQRMAFLESIRWKLYVFLSFAQQYQSDVPELVPIALDLALRRKAIGAEALAIQQSTLLEGKYPELSASLSQLASLRKQIAEKALAGPSTEGLAAHDGLLADWDAERERLEAELARQIPEMNLERKLRAVDHQTVARALPEGAVLVEFVRAYVFDFNAVQIAGELSWKSARYLAFVLAAGYAEEVALIDLGEAEAIDRMVAEFRQSIVSEPESRGSRDLGALPDKRKIRGPEPGEELRAAVFDPLLPSLAACERVLLAPDGDLTRLPFGVLPAKRQGRLIDDYRISYLGAGRDVLRFGAGSTGQATTSVVIAHPDFDLSGGRASAVDTEPAGRRSRGFRTADLRFGDLPGTLVEGQQVAAMMNVEPWLQATALEGQLRRIRSPRVLHLATHGFFLEDRTTGPDYQCRDLGAVGWAPSADVGRLSAARLENPLLRSGIALAGANTWIQGGSPPEEAEDGILTAEDVSGLDLLATSLVVLSACDSGLGEIRVGEGVFGLRRAFTLAGAKTLVMSLWKVPDLATAILMERFYDKLFHRGLARDESLRQAQLEVRDLSVGEIREKWLAAEQIDRLAGEGTEAARDLHRLARQAGDHQPFTESRYWGAFICQGEFGPLE